MKTTRSQVPHSEAAKTGIDFIHGDTVNDRLIVIQAHYPENTTKATPKTKWDGLVSAVPCLEDPEHFRKAGRPELASAVEDAIEQLPNRECLAILASFGADSDQIRRSLATTQKSKKFSDLSFSYHSNADIQKRYGALRDAGDVVPEDSIAFVDDKYFEDKGGYGRAYVGSVAADELTRLYEIYTNSLFARNVRLFLGTRKGGINERIVQTAQDAPGRFWALNNGITIVADTIKRDDKKKRFLLTRFSIVNGCQTTVSLAKAGEQKSAKVLVRVVAASHEVVGEIVQYNNTQNAIRIWTVRAADNIQEAIRSALRPHGIVYAPKPEGARKKRDPSTVIELDRVAQYLACKKQDTLIPSLREKSELFDRYYQSVFPHKITAEDVLLAWQIGNKADEKRACQLKALRDAGDLDATLSGLLAITGTYWIAYTTFALIDRYNTAPIRLTLAGMNAAEFSSALDKYVARALELYTDIAINTYEPDDHRSVRSALRSVPFLTKYSQKLKTRTTAAKGAGSKLPALESVLKSLPKKAR